MADEKNLDLYVASYPDESSATEDFTALKKARDVDELTVIAAVVASRDAEGKVEVKEHDAGAAHRALGWGAVGGLVVGLFSPALHADRRLRRSSPCCPRAPSPPRYRPDPRPLRGEACVVRSASDPLRRLSA